MNKLHSQIITAFLKRHGIQDKKRIKDVVKGFDLRAPVYERRLEEREFVWQFMRRVSAGHPFQQTGEWFALKGGTMDSLAIFSGGVGRTLHEYEVIRPVWSLEGTAAELPLNWGSSVGGGGGATQIFLPKASLHALVGRGTHLSEGGRS